MTEALVPKKVTGLLTRPLDYLGKYGTENMGRVIKVVCLLGGALLIWTNIDAINHFVHAAADTTATLFRLGLMGLAAWGLWYLISRPTFHRLAARAVDSGLETAHMWWVDRDKHGAARYSIRRLKSRITTAETARGLIMGVIERQTAVLEEQEAKAQEARRAAMGFEREIKRRQTDKSARPVNSEVGKLTDLQLDSSFQLAKERFRAHAEFHTAELRDRARLQQQAEQIALIMDAINGKVEKLETDLAIAIQRWELGQQKLIAAEAAADVIGGQEYQDFQRALKGIRDEAFAFEGQVRRYMDQLEPTVRAHRTDQAAGAIADDEYFRAFATDLGIAPDDVKARLALPAATPLPGVEELLDEGRVPTSTKVEKVVSQPRIR